MHVVPSLTPRRTLARAGKVIALMAALILLGSSWAVAAVCHGCEGGGGGGGSTGCGNLGAYTTFAQEPRINGTPKVGAASAFSKTGANPSPSNVDIDLVSWHIGASSTWSNTYAQVGAGATYTPVAADQSKYLFAKFEVSRIAPFCSEVWTTDAKSIGIGGALAPTIPPIMGGPSNEPPPVGTQLTATSGAWTPAASSYTWQWTRNGVDIAGKTGPTYTVVEADRGKSIAVRVNAVRAGHQPGVFTTQGLNIPGNVATSIAVTGLSGASRFGVAKKATITVSAASGVPAGAVEVRHGSTVLHRATLANGKAAVTLSKSLAVRAYSLTYAYVPVTGSTHVSSTLTRAHTVKKARTKTSHKWRKKPTRKKAGTLRVYVKSPDISKVTTGKVRIKVSGKTYTKTVKKGYVDIKIGKLKKGKRKLTRAYLGATSFEKAGSKKFSLKVK